MRWLLLLLLAGCDDGGCPESVPRSLDSCSQPGLMCSYPNNDCLCVENHGAPNFWECSDGEGPPDLAMRLRDLSGSD